MDEDEPDAIAAMVEFFYQQDYEVSYPRSMSEASPEAHGHTMIFHLQVYALANRLQIQDLKNLAAENFADVIIKHWGDPSFPAAIQFAYSIAPPSTEGDDLRASVVDVATAHAKDLFTNGGKEIFLMMMENNAEFGKDLSRSLAKRAYGF
jgi:hypothetical protein